MVTAFQKNKTRAAIAARKRQAPQPSQPVAPQLYALPMASDAVSYRMYMYGKKPLTITNAPCYSYVTYPFPLRTLCTKIVCIPNQKTSLGCDKYRQLFDILKNHHALPPKTRAYCRQGKNYLSIRPSAKYYARFYFAISMYRWQEFCPKFIEKMIDLYQERPHLNFFQTFQHVMVNNMIPLGHNFFLIYNMMLLNYGITLAETLKDFPDRSPCAAVHQVNVEVYPSRYGDLKTKPKKEHLASSTDDILDRKWTSLYPKYD